MNFRWPDEAQWTWLKTQVDQAAPLTMLNLLRFLDQADYSGGPEESPCTGIEAYKRYSKLALPCVADYGGSIAFSGRPGKTLVGPDHEQWHLMLLVKYPNVGAFLNMAASERYLSFAHHRTASIADSRLIPLAESWK